MYGYLVQFIYDNNINHVIIYLLITKTIYYYSARNKSILHMKQYIIIRYVIII